MTPVRIRLRDHGPGDTSEEERGVPVEYVAAPIHGRVYRTSRRVYLGDVDRGAHLRLEALARFLQDTATDDVDDVGIPDRGGVWVVRRVNLEITARPRYLDRVGLETFCSGIGPRWAERRTTMLGADGPLVEAAAIWVFIDGAGGRPLPLDDDFEQFYAEAAGGRRVSGRLEHPRPPEGVATRPWPVRESDFDILDHINNTRYLEAIEDELARRLPNRSVVRASIEYRGAVERRDTVELAAEVVGPVGDGAGDGGDGERQLTVWLLAGGEVRMSAVVTTVPSPRPMQRRGSPTERAPVA